MEISKLLKQDWIITFCIIILLTVGTMTIYSATYTAQTLVEGQGAINRQLIFIIIGVLIYYVISIKDYSWLQYPVVQIILYTGIIFLLVYLLVFGEEVRNTNRWIEVGFARIQPSEYAKIILILINAAIIAYFSEYKKDQKNVAKTSWSFFEYLPILKKFFNQVTERFPLAIPILLIILANGLVFLLVNAQPALGNGIIILILCITIFYISSKQKSKVIVFTLLTVLSANIIGGYFRLDSIFTSLQLGSLAFINTDIFILIASIATSAFFVITTRLPNILVIAALLLGLGFEIGREYAWDHYLEPYQKERVQTFFNPEVDPRGSGYQVRNSKIAIGSGRVFGKGFLHGTQSKLKYLPEAHNDFIFATFAEEFGFIGATLLLIVYGILILRITHIGFVSDSTFGFYISIGVAVMLVIHIFINIGMNVGIMPVTGIPLPLVSFGGSSIMVNMISLGLVQSVLIHRNPIDSGHKMMLLLRDS